MSMNCVENENAGSRVLIRQESRQAVIVDQEKPKLWSFFAWPVVGAALALSLLGMMSIGIFILPFAVGGLLALQKWGGSRKSSVGLISGVGLPFLYIAYLNRDGPGTVCTAFGNGGQQCTEEWSPWPWLLIGVALVALGVALFVKEARRHRAPLPSQ